MTRIVNTFAAKDTQEKVIYDSMARTGRYIDVGVSDVDKLLTPLFEFLQQCSRCSRLGGDSTVAVCDARTDFLDLIVRTVKDTFVAYKKSSYLIVNLSYKYITLVVTD